jgi:anti-sigma regulatory factor (Ser/Thr protein kinase)/anti-anti-sigma regulatory factor
VGETKFETINRHIHEALPSVRESCPEVGELTDMLIRRMARPRPEERFQTPQEVLEAFEADAGEARALLESAADLPPVREQIAEWRPGEPVEVRLRAREREYVHVISRKVEEMLEAEGVDPEFQGYAQTVFTELVANAFDHGCRDRPDGVVRIRLELNEAFFRVEVIDPGPGFAAREMLDRIKDEPLDRERRRGIFQVLGIADLLEYSPKGNHAKAVLYRKSEGSGVFSHTANDILYVEIKGKGDLALAETFRRWVENLHLAEPTRLCLMVRTDWVSSMFVGTIGKLQTAIQESGSALSVWAEHRSCYRIMQQLGVTSFVHIYDSLESAELALRYKSLARPGADGEESPAESAEDSPETPGAGEEPSARPSGPRSRRAADRRGSDRRRGAAPPESFWNRLRRLFGGK